MQSLVKEIKLALQSELLVLRDKHGVKLSRGEGDILARFRMEVEAPNTAAAAYDVGPISLQCSIHTSIMTAFTHGAKDTAGLEADWKLGLHVHISAPELPQVLASRIASRLHAGWVLAMQQQMSKEGSQLLQPLPGAFQLEVVILMLSTNFVNLLNLIPDLVEAYEGVDAEGRTMRRFTIIMAGVAEAPAPAPEPAPPAPTATKQPPHATEVQASASPPSATSPSPQGATPASAPATLSQDHARSAHAAAVQAFAAAAAALPAYIAAQPTGVKVLQTAVAKQQPAHPRAQGTPAHGQPASTLHSNNGDPSSDPSPAPSQCNQEVHPPLPVSNSTKLLDELRYLGKRYGSAFRLHQDACGPGVGSSQPQGYGSMRHSGAASTSTPASGVGALPTGFDLELLPTDRGWGWGSIKLQAFFSAPYPTEPHGASSQPAAIKAPTHTPQQGAAQGTPAAAAAAGAAGASCDMAPALEAGGVAGTGTGAGAGAGVSASVSASVSVSQPQAPPQAQAQVLVVLQAAPANPMPSWLTRHVDRVLSQQMHNAPNRPPGPVASALRYLENYGGEVATEAETLAREAGVRTRLGQHGAAPTPLMHRVKSVGDGGADLADTSGCDSDSCDSYDSDGDSCSSQTDGETGSEGGGSDDEYEAEEEEEVVNEIEFHAAGADADDSAGVAKGAGTAAGYAVVLAGMQLDNILAAEALRAVFQVVCDRCSHTGEMVLSSEAVAGCTDDSGAAARPFQASRTCPGCSAHWGLVMRPKFVHEQSNVLCSLKPVGARPLDLLPSLLAAQCAGCGAVMTARGVQVGLPFERNCSSCHLHITLHIPSVSFVPRGPTDGRGNKGAAKGGVVRAAAAARAAAPRGALAAFNGVLQVGQPLPAYGTCRHYRHSYRWLRFPCCGVRFPCDLCHEELTADGHEARWAQRMVCGFCSVEQTVAGSCKACGKMLARGAGAPSGRRSRFWEGGEGCRDKSRMNRNDPHKYRNSKAKTKSAKHKRVGAKAYSKELKKDASKDSN